ncbi:hypothetical protein Poli38472_012979 [Pythium oligandrum]|uniref:Major facilitator superfamily (MFS) profile domain-containing protein n=1 Tax=Pythium oligandrum TaxID=41045 RepID=A0A8K1CJ21_PYTOL|nr:hypothetical protein Poli38472_012979 [Pythium oligandrum]|eukprot:TMW64357.1 hypothetical protein Poli38472_012979 [Pythium oligandrum]
MGIETAISLLIVVFVVVGAVYDVELNHEGRVLHSRGYRWRRLQNWFPMGIAYAAFYMARYDVAAGNIQVVREQLQFSSSFMGWVMSAGSWSYAASAPFTGQITDRIGGRNGMIVACLGSALCNLTLGVLFLSDLPLTQVKVLFVVLFAGNVLMQGFGTSAVVKINAAWYSPNERGVFAGVFNIMLTSGYYLSLGTGSSIISNMGWAYVFIIPGVALLTMSFAVLCWVKNSPRESTKMARINQRGSVQTAAKAAEDAGLSPREQMRRLFQNRTFLGYLTAIFFLSWARDGFLNWFLSFFDAVRGQDNALTTADTAIIGGAWTIGGFVGGITCGWISDVLFKSDRVAPICIFSVFQAILLGVLYNFSASCPVEVLGVLVFLTSVFLLGNYTLLSYTVPSDLPQDIAAGASGIITSVAYFATGLSGAAMGHLIEGGGYRLWVFSLMVASVFTGVFTACGAYFSKDTSGMMISEVTLEAELELDETTPLSSRSLSKRRASIVRLSTDFIASPMLDLRSVRSRRSFEP